METIEIWYTTLDKSMEKEEFRSNAWWLSSDFVELECTDGFIYYIPTNRIHRIVTKKE